MEADSFDDMGCGHTFCSECWRSYLAQKLAEGPHSITAKCMRKGCGLAVPHSMWLRVLKDDAINMGQYVKFSGKNFTDDNKNVKWCPSPGCVFVIQVNNLARKDITCECGTYFCFKCCLPSHRPCSCETISMWN